MRHNKFSIGIIMALLFGFTAMQAQESINSTGGDSSNPTGSASYSIWQVTYTSNAATTGSVRQRFQQSFEISVVTSTQDAKTLIWLFQHIRTVQAIFLL